MCLYHASENMKKRFRPLARAQNASQKSCSSSSPDSTAPLPTTPEVLVCPLSSECSDEVSVDEEESLAASRTYHYVVWYVQYVRRLFYQMLNK